MSVLHNVVQRMFNLKLIINNKRLHFEINLLINLICSKTERIS